MLKLAVAFWSHGLTVSQMSQIERVQKTVCAVVLGNNHIGYKQSLDILNLKPLDIRRQELCSKFAMKCFKSDKFKTWFVDNTNTVDTRSDGLQYLSGTPL